MLLVFYDPDTGALFGATGAQVFCIDITGICDGTTDWQGAECDTNLLKDGDDNRVNFETKGDYKGTEIKAEVTSIKCDGEEIEFDASKIATGNIENNNNRWRIEIFNTYGVNAADPAVDPANIAFENTLEVTFKIEGLGEVAEQENVATNKSIAAPAGGAAEGDAAADDSAADESAAEGDAAADESAAE